MEVPFSKLTSVCVEEAPALPQKGHEIRIEWPTRAERAKGELFLLIF